jgi:ABC-type uncharacterized transport system permease subunit
MSIISIACFVVFGISVISAFLYGFYGITFWSPTKDSDRTMVILIFHGLGVVFAPLIGVISMIQKC